MEVFIYYYGRCICIMGSMGDVVGDEKDLLIINFCIGEQEYWNVYENMVFDFGYGGGDWGLVCDWLQVVDQ